MILHSMNLGGNLHATTDFINKAGLTSHLFSLHSVSGSSTIAIFRFENKDIYDYFKEKGTI